VRGLLEKRNRREGYTNTKWSLGTRYGIKDLTEEEYTDLCHAVRYFDVERIVCQQPRGDNQTNWIMVVMFRGQEVILSYIAPGDYVDMALHPVHYRQHLMKVEYAMESDEDE